jgi:hypothetical protein
MNTRLRCAVGFACAALATSAHAFEFSDGELSGSFDTTVTAAAAWRVQARDPALIGIANGGTSRSVNEDNGNLNYDRNDPYATTFRATHELELKYHNLGAFFRTSYFWDAVNHDKRGLGDAGIERVGHDFELFDAYVRGHFEPLGRALDVRLGNQVVSWGESTFIANGINVINPVDVSKLRAPGAELREAFLPVPMLWASQTINGNLSVEGFYQATWKKTRLDPRGTYFSSNDFISPDSDRVYAGFGRRRDANSPLTSPLADPAASVWVPRSADHAPRDNGQYGVALRIFLPDYNSTEIGLYHVNYHSRTPLVSGVRGSASNALAAGSARYYADYPEAIRLWGASFNTAAPGGVALQGEYSYRPNLPLQLSAPELLLAALGLPNTIGTFSLGSTITGYRRIAAQQVQMTATKAFGPTWKADEFVVVGEAGYSYLDLPAKQRFNGPAVYLPSLQSAANLASFGSIQTDGFATRTSWGYRLLARMDFADAFYSATVSPRVAFAHDVRGVSPTFNEGVKAITLGLGFNLKQTWQADLSYTNYFGGRTYSGIDKSAPPGQSLNYASSANPLKDRDFVAASLSYSF